MLLEGLRRKGGPTVTAPLTLDSPAGWQGWTEDSVAMSRDRAMKHSVVARCVEVRSTAMAMLPPYIMNENTKERIADHPVGRLWWDAPNEAMNWADFERLSQANEDLRGNAYSWINHNNRTGEVVELIPLSPDHVTPYVTREGALYYIWTNPRTGEMFRLDPADVLHYKGYSVDGINGLSILSRAALSVSTGLAAQRFQGDVYANGGRPSGVLTMEGDLGGKVAYQNTKGETEEISRKEVIRREWEKIHAGAGNGFRVAVLDHGLKYQPISLSNTEAQFVESEEQRVADICRFFSVPLHLCYAGKQSYSSNEQNSLEFVKYSLQFLVTQREQENTRKLLLPRDREKGLRVRRELKALLRGDTAAQGAWYKTMRDVGAYNVDEIRALEDLGKVPGGQTRYANLNNIPLDRFDELSVARNTKDKELSE